MEDEVKSRLDRLEDVVSDVKEIPSNVFEEDDSSSDEVETCEEVKSDGEVCGRPLPCPYHSGDEA